MRASGVLMHLTSLPSLYGMGGLGDADKFVKFLVKAGVKYWQVLPTTPTDFLNSPYSSSSSFAGNVYLIDFDALADTGLLLQSEILECKRFKDSNFELAKQNKTKLLRSASKNFYKQNPPLDFDTFCEENCFWLNDFALFSAVKGYFNEVAWIEFPDTAIRFRKPDAIAYYTDKLSDEIDFVKFCQYIFFKQWEGFRKNLRQNGVSLIGDIPFYVAYDSADVWVNAALFDLDEQCRPKNVAGVPPDYFNQDGQLWGNALYNFKEMKKDGFAFLVMRYKHAGSLVDILRIDHFRAFDAYYSIKYGQTTAKRGKWKKGVGLPFLKLIIEALPNTQIIAEDLGIIPQSVLDLRDKCGFWGMKVLQFAFDGNRHNPFLPHNYPQNCVAYLGTHDNDTTQGWWHSLGDYHRSLVLNYLQTEASEDINFKLISLLAASNADIVIYTMQDIAGNGSDCRMNIPSHTGCWTYMAKNEDFSNENAKRLYEINRSTGRI